MSTYAEDVKAETFLEKAKRRIKASRDAFRLQREREESDLRFQVPELQWDAAAKSARAGGNVNGTPTPARPLLSISKLDQPIQLVDNQARAAKLGVNVHPVSEKASKETAEVRQGLYRRIERDSNADQARLWAFDRAVKAGMGAYIVRTKFDEDAPETFDQEIVIERILYQNMVGFDPAAQKPDFSDGEYSWLGAWVPIETFKRDFQKATYAQAEDSDWALDGFAEPEWVEGDGNDRTVLVVEYFYKIHNRETFKAGGRTRERDIVTVKWAKLCGDQVLEEEDWNGHYLPIIPVLGRELQPFDKERRWVGMIGPAKDGQKLYNFSASTFVENMASEPKNPWVGAEGQFEGHESQWLQSNVRTFPYLEYKPVSLGGVQAPPPQRTQIDTSKMQLSMLGMQEADKMIQSSTSIYDPSLGRENPRDKSGRAILALQSQSDAGTSHFLASYADVSMTYEALVVMDLMPAIYDRPGRISRILTGEDKDKLVMLNAPFIRDQSGFPQPAKEGQQGAEMYDLRNGSGYSVSVSIGKSFQTRLQQGSEQIGEILSNAPNLLPVIGDIYFKYQDIPGADEIAKRMTKWRESVMPGLGEGEEGQMPSPEQLQAQVTAMQQQGQLLQAQLQQAMEMIKTDRAKQEAMIQKAQMDSQTKLQLQKMQDATDMQIARLNAAVKGGTLAQDARDEQVVLAEEHAFGAHQADKDREHETETHREEMAHEVALAAAGGRSVTVKRDQGQERGEERGQEQSSKPAAKPKGQA